MKLLNRYFFFVLLPCVVFFCQDALAQDRKKKNSNIVYVDKQGVLRYSSNKMEAAFFGINYTVPFAYSYRAHKALNIDLQKAIQQDVYHFARLGLDAFRVHVWDTEISDSSGNLLENEHLKLFDFLLAELKKRNIKTIITPIAFWGNGYPERDEPTPGFSAFFGRAKLTTNDTAIKAQENYIHQFFNHVNPYTKLTYEEDKDIIAVEINNEPSHSGPKQAVTNYINRLAAALKSTGWSKPVFYNISQSPFYSDAVAASSVDGFSFQWYPSGLVSGRTLKGNYLPNVDVYNIPYRDTIPAFAKKALMVYEFDAADIFQSCIYPAMARSFRSAGFQWATQFAYDPMALAYANTEYQTHYLNLAYTPSKAISMLIASEVFHKVPRLKNYGAYPADSVFDMFRVSYKESLSEMNAEQKFYYSNTSQSKPVNKNQLKHIAGVGNSAVVVYTGTGAYFLDKIQEAVWRLEVMPDVIHIRDPFEKASPQKEVSSIHWRSNKMQIRLDDIGSGFSIRGLNEGNTFSSSAQGDSFQITPGTYLLIRNGKTFSNNLHETGVIGLNEFVAPQSSPKEIFLRHESFAEVSSGKPFTITAIVAGMDSGKVTLQINKLGGGPFRNIPMIKKEGYEFAAEVPADMVTSGLLNYRIIVQEGNTFSAFPGNFKDNPLAWDTYHFETWKTFVAAENANLELYNPAVDRNIFIYPSFRRNFQTSYITGENTGSLILRLSATEMQPGDVMGFQYFVGDKLKPRNMELNTFDKIIIRAKTASLQPVKTKITFITKDAVSFSLAITLTDNFQDTGFSFSDFKKDSSLLLPRSYPGFQPLWFKGSGTEQVLKLDDVEKIEVTAGPSITPSGNNKTCSIDIESIRLIKRK